MERVVSAHSGADFEAGRLGHRNGEAPNDGAEHDVVNAREPERTRSGSGAGQRGIDSFLSGAASENEWSAGAPGRKRQKKAAETEQFSYQGKQLTIFKGTHAAEDKRWVVILELKENNTKKYRCLRCGGEFTGRPNRIVSHCLRIRGEQVAICSKTPTEAQEDVLRRLRGDGSSSALKSAVKTPAVGSTPCALDGLSKQTNMLALVDEELAKFICANDLPWAAFCSRNPQWDRVVQAMQRAGSAYKPAPRERLSEHRAPVGDARPGGLHLAMLSTRRERRQVTATATGELSTGGTLVSDGAKLSTRKRGMLNSSLVTTKGVNFLQSTDATGKTKNGEFLRDDLSAAIEKAGPYKVVSRQKANGDTVEKKSSEIVKVCILDRGGGCKRALTLLEESWRILGDTCKGHGADLLIEDLAKPFKPHLKLVHELIIFIISHDPLFGIFIGYEGTRSLAIPADTRFATEIICVRSALVDIEQIKKLFVDPQYDAWHHKQSAEMRTKSRKMKVAALDDTFWHKSKVFVSLTEVVETSLRILDSDKPNLKDAAFAFYRIEKEIADPLTSRLAKIPEWGEIDLGLQFRSEHLGTLGSFAKAQVQKRKEDWLSPPVVAAAAVNPIYSFAFDEEERWAVPGADAAMRVVISKLFWGEERLQSEAIDGWDRFHTKSGIYDETGEVYEVLRFKLDNPEGFFRHVAGTSTLQADKIFVQVAIWLVSAFANQGASERTNKYLAEIHSKKRASLKLEKGEVMLEVKMHEIYKTAQRKASAGEQRCGRRSVAEDLRLVFERARGAAKEKRALQLRMAALRQEEQEAQVEEGAEEERLVTAEDACDVLGEQEAPLRVPAGFEIVRCAPSTEQLDSSKAESDALLGKVLMVRFEHYGWCKGTITGKVVDRRRTINKEAINFIAEFDIDDGASTDLSLDVSEYDPSPSADYQSWLLLQEG